MLGGEVRKRRVPGLSLPSLLEMDGGVSKLCGLKPPLSAPTAGPKPQRGRRAGGDEP